MAEGMHRKVVGSGTSVESHNRLCDISFDNLRNSQVLNGEWHFLLCKLDDWLSFLVLYGVFLHLFRVWVLVHMCTHTHTHVCACTHMHTTDRQSTLQGSFFSIYCVGCRDQTHMVRLDIKYLHSVLQVGTSHTHWKDGLRLEFSIPMLFHNA